MSPSPSEGPASAGAWRRSLGLLGGGGWPSVQANPSDPPMTPSSVPMKNPPRFEAIRAVIASTTATIE
jgi:hypothetical protein